MSVGGKLGPRSLREEWNSMQSPPSGNAALFQVRRTTRFFILGDKIESSESIRAKFC